MNLRTIEVLDGPERVQLANTTNHPLGFFDKGRIVVAPQCGVTLPAQLVETLYGYTGGIALYRKTYVPVLKTLNLIAELRSSVPRLILVGSVIPMQAYPGSVVGLRPVLHTLPNGEIIRLMRSDQFNTYEGVCSTCGHVAEEDRTAIQTC